MLTNTVSTTVIQAPGEIEKTHAYSLEKTIQGWLVTFSPYARARKFDTIIKKVKANTKTSMTDLDT
jgi:hypothetical protein